MTSPKDPRKRTSSRAQYRPEQVGSVKRKELNGTMIGMMVLRTHPLRIQLDTMFDTTMSARLSFCLLPQFLHAKSECFDETVHTRRLFRTFAASYVAKYHTRILR